LVANTEVTIGIEIVHADAFVFQSEFQRKQLEPQLAPLGYDRSTGHLIRGAFDLDEWEFRPRPHGQHEPFVVGACRAAGC
jgi:hypothetical protein